MKNVTVILKEIEPNFYPPILGGIMIYRPEYRTLPCEEVIQQAGLVEYAEFGYKTFLLNRRTGTVHIYST
jgi:hypothetical protein